MIIAEDEDNLPRMPEALYLADTIHYLNLGTKTKSLIIARA